MKWPFNKTKDVGPVSDTSRPCTGRSRCAGCRDLTDRQPRRRDRSGDGASTR
jgi:hypothetical protein